MRRPASRVVAEAARALADAGVVSARSEAEQIVSRVIAVSRSRLALADEVSAADESRVHDLVGRRARREPLQYLLGTAAFRHVEVTVGPGVFVPRPETELLAGWAVDRLREVASSATPVAVDLCTGSGAIALALATEVPSARVHAVELDPEAFAYAEANLRHPGVDLRAGDFAGAFTDLDGEVDVVVSNPPYIPLEAWESVAPEARDHEPALALWSGADGLDAIRGVERVAARLLRPGGWVGVEHADAQGESAPAVFRATQRWHEVVDHHDLAGRPRFITARLRG